jgi:hypothetical protein
MPILCLWRMVMNMRYERHKQQVIKDIHDRYLLYIKKKVKNGRKEVSLSDIYCFGVMRL